MPGSASHLGDSARLLGGDVLRLLEYPVALLLDTYSSPSLTWERGLSSISPSAGRLAGSHNLNSHSQ